MGIKGLLKHLDSIQVDTHVSDFNGQVCGIDGYVWLHRAVYPNATELVMSKGNLAKEAIAEEKVARQVIKYAESVMSCGVDLYMVFDGRSTEAKRQEESMRQGGRAKNLEQGHGMYRAGNTDLAHKRFAASIDVTPRMAARVCRLLKQRNIPFVVAPYEADAQLSHLFHTGQVQFCISEDSDLLTHGVHTVLYKLDFRNLIGKVIHLHRDAKKVSGVLAPIMNLGMETEVAHRRFIAMCVLFGCDYGPTTIPKAGPKKVVDLLNRLSKKDEEGFSDPVKIVNIARFLGLDVNPEFAVHYEKAIFCFNHHTVFNTTEKRLEPQREIKSERPSWADDVAGRILDNEIARKIAKAEIDPFTFEPFDFGDELVEEMMEAKENGGKMDNGPRIQDGMAMLLVGSQWKKTVTARREPKRLVILPSKNQPTIDQFFKKIPKKKEEEEEVRVCATSSSSSSPTEEEVLPLRDGPETESTNQATTCTSNSSERKDPMLTNIPRFAQQPPNAQHITACNGKDPFEAFTFSRSTTTTSGANTSADSIPLADGPTISTTNDHDHVPTGTTDVGAGAGGADPSTKRRNKKRANPYRTNVQENGEGDRDREFPMVLANTTANDDELFKSFYLQPHSGKEGVSKHDKNDDEGGFREPGSAMIVESIERTSGKEDKEERNDNIITSAASLGSKRPKLDDANIEAQHITDETTSANLGSQQPLPASGFVLETKDSNSSIEQKDTTGVLVETRPTENPYRISIPHHSTTSCLNDSNQENDDGDDDAESASAYPSHAMVAHGEGTNKREKEGKCESSGMRKVNPYRIPDASADDTTADASTPIPAAAANAASTPIPDDGMTKNEPPNRCTDYGSGENNITTPPPKQRRRSVVPSKPAIILPYRSSQEGRGRRRSLASINSPTTTWQENSDENAKADGTKSPYSGSSSGIPFGETDTTTPVVTLAENFFSQFAFSEAAETGTTSSTSNSIMNITRGGGYLAKETPTETPEKAGKNRGTGSIGSSGLNVHGQRSTVSVRGKGTPVKETARKWSSRNAGVAESSSVNDSHTGDEGAAPTSTSVNGSINNSSSTTTTTTTTTSTQQQKPGDKTSRRRLRKRSEGTDEGVDSNIDIHNSTLNVGEKRPENDGRKRARRSVTAERNDESNSSSNVREGPPAPVKGRGKGKKPAPTTTSSEGKKPSTDNTASEEAHSLNSQQNEDGSTTGESIRDSPPTPSEETIPGADPFAQFFFNKATWQAA